MFSLALTASLSMLLYLLREPCSALFHSDPEVIAVGAAMRRQPHNMALLVKTAGMAKAGLLPAGAG